MVLIFQITDIKKGHHEKDYSYGDNSNIPCFYAIYGRTYLCPGTGTKGAEARTAAASAAPAEDDASGNAAGIVAEVFRSTGNNERTDRKRRGFPGFEPGGPVFLYFREVCGRNLGPQSE